MAQEVLQRRVTFGRLFQAGRPSTAIYAFTLTLVGFSFYKETPWAVRILTAVVFAGLTMSTMVYNDWVDREHDRKKGKTLASDHPGELFRYWWWLSGLTALLLAGVALENQWSGVFCASVWVVGILYSHARRLYFANNLMVAACAGSPALCGMVHTGVGTQMAIIVFLLFSSLIFVREVYKDVEDIQIDRGYKKTMPARVGTIPTIVWLNAALLVPGLMYALLISRLSSPWVTGLACVSIGLVAFRQGCVMLRPERIREPKLAMNLALGALLLALLFF